MSDSNEYKLEDLEKLSNKEIREIASGLGINLNQKLEDLIKQILHPRSRKFTKAATKKFRTLKVETKPQTKPQTKKLPPRKKESSRSSKSSSSRRETPSPISEGEKLFLNKQVVQSVISRIIIDNDEYTFLSEIDFKYTEISKLLNIDYTNEWAKTSKKVIKYLESNNILKLAQDLEYLNSINELKKIINTHKSQEKIKNLCDNITETIIRINKNIKSQSNNIIKIKEQYKNTINTDIDKFNSKEIIKSNNFTIRNKLI